MGLDQPGRDHGQRHDGQKLSRRINAAPAPATGFRHETQRQHDRDQANGHIDPENRLPPHPMHQNAAHHRPQRKRHARRRPPYADRLRAGAGFHIHIGQDRQRDGIEHGPANPLHRAGHDQHFDTARNPAQGGTATEQPDPQQEHPPPPEPVSQRPHQQHEAGDHQRIGVHYPLQGGKTAMHIRADGGEHDVDDRHVHHDQQQAETARAQHDTRVNRGRTGHCHVRLPLPCQQRGPTATNPAFLSGNIFGYCKGSMERAKGIEPSSEAWKATALPLCYARS